MKQFRPIFLVWLIPLITVFGGENLLKNPTFLEKDGKIFDWRFKDKDGVSVKENILTFDMNQMKQGFAVQDVPLKDGMKYQFTFEAKGTPGMLFNAYVEWTELDSSGESWNVCRLKDLKSEDSWKSFNCTFDFNLKAAVKRKPYFALAVKDQKGIISFRNPILTELGIAGKKFTDGDFENQNGWQLTRKSRIAPTGGASGPHVLELDGQGARAEQRSILVNAGKTYKLAYSVRHRGDSGTSTNYGQFKVLAEVPVAGLISGSEMQDVLGYEYQRKENVFQLSGSGPMLLNIICENHAGSVIMLDDFELNEVLAEEQLPMKIELTEPWFRNNIYAEMPLKSLKGTLKVEKNVTEVLLEFTSYRQKFQPSGGKIEFEIPIETLADGKYELKATPAGKNGETLAVSSLAIRKLPPAKNSVLIGKDKNFYSNGQKYFPTGISFTNVFSLEDESALYIHRQNGISFLTVAIFKPADIKTLKPKLDALERFGIKARIWIRPGGYVSVSKLHDPEKRYREIIEALSEELITHPAVFCYILFDEPAWSGVSPEFCRRMYELLKEHDPYHPVGWVEAPRGTVGKLKPYAVSADFLGIDIYPIPYPNTHSGLADKTPTAVGGYTMIAREIVEDKMPILMILQAWSWKSGDKTRFPTREELRFMAYDAMLHDAHGLSWFTSGLESSVDLLRDFFQVNSEITAMSELLTAGKEITGISAAAPLYAVGKMLNGEQWFYVLNRSGNPVEGSIKLPLPEGTQLHVYGDERTVAITDGVLKDRFDIYSVHVYSTSRIPPGGPAKLPAVPEFDRTALTRLTDNIYTMDRNATWICYPGKLRTPDLVTYYIKEFETDENIVSAILHLAVDDEHITYVNGEEVFSSEHFRRAKRFDLTGLLRNGKNVIAVEAKNHKGAGGVIGSLTLKNADGSEEILYTDASWQTSVLPQDFGWISGRLKEAVNAQVVGKSNEAQVPWKQPVYTHAR